jgi:hypothetical protein
MMRMQEAAGRSEAACVARPQRSPPLLQQGTRACRCTCGPWDDHMRCTMRRELREAVDAALAQLVERLVLPRIRRRWVAVLQCRCSDIRGKRVEGARTSTAALNRALVVALRRVRGPRQERRRRGQGARARCQAGPHRWQAIPTLPQRSFGSLILFPVCIRQANAGDLSS